MINVTMDICGYVNGTHDNISAKWFIGQYFKSMALRALHPCPYKSLKLYNMTTDMSALLSTFLRGIYRGYCRFYDDFDDNMFTTIYTGEYY
jgi:hypothetical protein